MDNDQADRLIKVMSLGLTMISIAILTAQTGFVIGGFISLIFLAFKMDRLSRF